MSQTSRWSRCAATALAGVLLMSAQTARGDASFAETFKNWSSLALQGPGRPVHGMRLSGAHFTVDLTSGSVAPVVAGREVVGVYFVGTGTVEYTTEDPVELPIVAYNVRKNTALKALPQGKGLVIRDTVDEVLWLSAGNPLPDLPPDSTGGALDRRFEAHLNKFGQVLISAKTLASMADRSSRERDS